jgi:N-acetylated-alpha-linked acidic dipeptidase
MQNYLVELIGTFFLVLVIGLTVIDPGAGALAPLAIGSTLMVMVYAGGHISGGHYNPAVTLAVWLRGKCAAKDVAPYMIAQVLGGIIAALVVSFCKPNASVVAASPDIGRALLVELLFTFALCYVVLNTATSKKNAGNSYYGLAKRLHSRKSRNDSRQRHQAKGDELGNYTCTLQYCTRVSGKAQIANSRVVRIERFNMKKVCFFLPPQHWLPFGSALQIFFGLFIITVPALSQTSNWASQFLDLPRPDSCRAYLFHLTEEPHVAGTPQDYETAEYVMNKFKSFGFSTEMIAYDVYLPYPKKVEFQITLPIQFTGPTPEAGFAGDKDSFGPDVILPFHAYSPAAEAEGQVVYVNYGLPEDYEKLEELGVSVRDRIVLVRYGKSYRGVKVYVAEQRGARAVLIYSDPEDDGYMQGEVYPHGPMRPETGIQRGSVQYFFRYPGDPLTPGWASTPTSERLAPERASNLPRIPSMPISYGDAEKILRHLAGPNVPKGWQGGLPFPYHVGPGPAALQLKVVMDYQVRPIWNVIGTLRGNEDPENLVIAGNHRDAWTYGAVDPGSGTAVLLEMARTFGELARAGYRPRRTIKFASWDGEEYGLVGSTEWVENYKTLCSRNVVAYVNIDAAISGDRFSAGASPTLRSFIQQMAGTVIDPKTNRSVVSRWWHQQNENKKRKAEPDWTMVDTVAVAIEDLGSGSDFAAFVDFTGVPSISMSFGGPYGVYHAVYDNFYWMEKFGDPTFAYHATMTKMAGLMVMELADRPILPVDILAFSRQMKRAVKNVQAALKDLEEKPTTQLDDLSRKIDEWVRVAQNWRKLSSNAANLELLDQRTLNGHLMAIDRAFIAPEGLPGRTWHKNLYVAPGEYTGYAAQLLPALQECLDKNELDRLPVEESRLLKAVENAILSTQAAVDLVQRRMAGGGK